jgi:hypothetical protein
VEEGHALFELGGVRVDKAGRAYRRSSARTSGWPCSRCSTRKLSLTTMLFCAACAWRAGQLAAVAGGAAPAGYAGSAGTGGGTGGSTGVGTGGAGAGSADHASAPASAAAAAARAARAACGSVLFSAAVRKACWNYTAYFASEEPAS